MVPVTASEPTGALTAVEPTHRASLTVVARRRRWPALLGGFVSLVLLAAMLGAAVFHTQLAERQLEIDALTASVEQQRSRFEALQAERARLFSPEWLSGEATRLGLTRQPRSGYLEVDPWALARQLAAAGAVSEGLSQIIVQASWLEEFREIKSLSVGQR